MSQFFLITFPYLTSRHKSLYPSVWQYSPADRCVCACYSHCDCSQHLWCSRHRRDLPQHRLLGTSYCNSIYEVRENCFSNFDRQSETFGPISEVLASTKEVGTIVDRRLSRLTGCSLGLVTLVIWMLLLQYRSLYPHFPVRGRVCLNFERSSPAICVRCFYFFTPKWRWHFDSFMWVKFTQNATQIDNLPQTLRTS